MPRPMKFILLKDIILCSDAVKMRTAACSHLIVGMIKYVLCCMWTTSIKCINCFKLGLQAGHAGQMMGDIKVRQIQL